MENTYWIFTGVQALVSDLRQLSFHTKRKNDSPKQWLPDELLDKMKPPTKPLTIISIFRGNHFLSESTMEHAK